MSVVSLYHSMDRSPRSRLFCKQPGDHSAKIFMVHGDEANSLVPKYLPENIPFYAFYHMCDKGELFPFHSIEEIARHYVQEMKTVQAHGPYFICGYSIGGVIAYEMAQQLKNQGEDIANLILIDSKAPGLNEGREYHNRQIRWNESRASRLLKKASRKMTVAYHAMYNHRIPKPLRAFYLMEIYRKARASYKPERWNDDITLIRSTVNNFRSSMLGWKQYVKGNIQVFDIESDHHEITSEPYILDIAGILKMAYCNSFTTAKAQ